MAREQWQHLYNLAAWVVLRKWRLSTEPLCRMCATQGRTTEATVCDHIEPHKGDIRLFLNGENTQSLCKTCHDGAKHREEIRGYAVGCDTNGNPIDTTHHWNQP